MWFLKYVNNLFHVLIIHTLEFHHLENGTFSFGKRLGTLLCIISKFYIHPNGYSAVVITGVICATITFIMYAPIACTLHTWTTCCTGNISCIFTLTISTITTGSRLGTCTLLGYHTFTTSCRTFCHILPLTPSTINLQ